MDLQLWKMGEDGVEEYRKIIENYNGPIPRKGDSICFDDIALRVESVEWCFDTFNVFVFCYYELDLPGDDEWKQEIKEKRRKEREEKEEKN